MYNEIVLISRGEELGRVFKSYMSILTVLAAMLFAIAVSRDLLVVDMSYLIILIALIFAEVGYISYGGSNKATITMPIVTFALLRYELIMVYIAIIIYNLIYRLISVYRDKANERIFNIKLLYGITSHIVLAALTTYVLRFLSFDLTISTAVLIWCMFYVLIILNVLMTTTAIYLSGDKSAYRFFNPLAYFQLVNYYTIAFVVIYLLSKAYYEVGLAIAIISILFTQTSMLMKSSSKAINDLLIFDRMTGAYNRAYFEDQIASHLFRKQPFTLTFIDLDDFKHVNDLYGHMTGDKLLADFVAILKNMIGPEELLFRYGGDEFCVFSPGKVKMKHLKKDLDDLIFVYKLESSDQMIHYKISSGEYFYAGYETVNYSDVIHEVDQHMYFKKKKKKIE